MRINYFERAASYAQTAEELEAQGLKDSAKRAREKAASWNAWGQRHKRMLAVWGTLLLQRERFLKRVTRKHRWKCRAWGTRCQHMRGERRDR